MRKGDLVRLNKRVCFTKAQGGNLRYPLGNHREDENLVVPASRPVTSEETEAWYKSDHSKGINSAGESKLPPRSVTVILHADRVYQVLRARCRVSLGWGNPTPGMTKLLCTYTGSEAYVKRDLLEVIGEEARC